MAHDQLRLDLLDRVHGHAHDDQQRCAAEVEVEAHAGGEPCRQEAVQPGADAERDLRHMHAGDQKLRQDADGRQVDGADEGDAGQHAVDVVRRLLARADAGDEAAVLAHVVGGVDRIEYN